MPSASKHPSPEVGPVAADSQPQSQLPESEQSAVAFVRREGTALVRAGQPYRVMGMNLWYGAYLATTPKGVRRLKFELDLLQSHGINNLRVLGGSEAGPMRHSIEPAFSLAPRQYNERLLCGLDRLLVEMAAREMTAVIYLTNFWEWSGGMGTYLAWTRAGDFIDMCDTAHPWPAFVLRTMQFYDDGPATRLFSDYAQSIVRRSNSLSGVAYRNDPTIMAWQLANEPRMGYKREGNQHAAQAFGRWVDAMARRIKSWDPNHLVSSGSEGSIGCVDDIEGFRAAHETPAIDYLTCHMWPKNWSWLDEADMTGSLPKTLELADAYLREHVQQACLMNKPLVLEEFGLPRDDGALQPGSATRCRDRFFQFLFEQVERSVDLGGPLVGSNVWGWAGSGRAQHADRCWRNGDTEYTGDPPHEPQGMNSVYDTDESTRAVLRAHTAWLASPTSGTQHRSGR